MVKFQGFSVSQFSLIGQSMKDFLREGGWSSSGRHLRLSYDLHTDVLTHVPPLNASLHTNKNNLRVKTEQLSVTTISERWQILTSFW